MDVKLTVRECASCKAAIDDELVVEEPCLERARAALLENEKKDEEDEQDARD